MNNRWKNCKKVFLSLLKQSVYLIMSLLTSWSWMTQLNRFHMEMPCFWKPITSRCLANARKWRTPLLPTLAVVKHQRWRFAWGLRSSSESFVTFQEYIIPINTELSMIASRLCSRLRTLWQNLKTRYKMITQNDFSFSLPIITDIVSKILPPSF